MRATALTVRLAELFNPDSGRLDAQRIADYLSVPLSRIAGAIGWRYQSLHKTPDSEAAQARLFPLKRCLDILDEVIGERSTILAWLNSPHTDLGRRTPLQVIMEGHADVVEGMLEDALTGAPS